MVGYGRGLPWLSWFLLMTHSRFRARLKSGINSIFAGFYLDVRLATLNLQDRIILFPRFSRLYVFHPGYWSPRRQ